MDKEQIYKNACAALGIEKEAARISLTGGLADMLYRRLGARSVGTVSAAGKGWGASVSRYRPTGPPLFFTGGEKQIASGHRGGGSSAAKKKARKWEATLGKLDILLGAEPLPRQKLVKGTLVKGGPFRIASPEPPTRLLAAKKKAKPPQKKVRDWFSQF